MAMLAKIKVCLVEREDCAGFHGGDLVGNECRKLMPNANAIIYEVEPIVLKRERVSGNNNKIYLLFVRKEEDL